MCTKSRQRVCIFTHCRTLNHWSWPTRRLLHTFCTDLSSQTAHSEKGKEERTPSTTNNVAKREHQVSLVAENSIKQSILHHNHIRIYVQTLHVCTERLSYKSMQGLLFICWQMASYTWLCCDSVPCKLVNSSFHLLFPNGTIIQKGCYPLQHPFRSDWHLFHMFTYTCGPNQQDDGAIPTASKNCSKNG